MTVRKPIPARIQEKVRKEARNRCGYCLSPQHLVMGRLEIEHIIPLSARGSDDKDNLWLACRICNSHKSDKTSSVNPQTGQTVPLFDPRRQKWSEHFRWADDRIRIVGRTAIGRATVLALHLDSDPTALLVRSGWVLAGWFPPKD
jgi:HNH endonuclease